MTKVLLAMLIVLVLAGCSRTAVRCEGHLTPINSPAAAEAPSGTERAP